MLHKFFLILAGFVLVTSLIACGHSPVLLYKADDGRILPSPIEGDLVATANPPLVDVPMPEGFLFIESKSKSVVSGSVRQVTHVYQGRATRQQCVAYFQKILPKMDWQLITDRMIGVNEEMHYTRGRETLEIRVQFEAGVSTLRVRIHSDGKGSSPVSQP